VKRGQSVHIRGEDGGGDSGCVGAFGTGGSFSQSAPNLEVISLSDLQVVYDDADIIDKANSQFVIPEDGDYIYTIRVNGPSNGGPGYLAAVIASAVNTTQERISFPSATYLYTMLHGGPRRLQVGDTVYFMLQHDGAGTSWSLSFVSIQKVCDGTWTPPT